MLLDIKLKFMFKNERESNTLVKALKQVISRRPKHSNRPLCSKNYTNVLLCDLLKERAGNQK